MFSHDKFSVLPISSLFFAIAFLAIGYGLTITFIGVHLKEQGTSEIAIGIINASFFFGGMLASTFSQKIISNVGHIRSFAVFASLMIITFLAQALYFNEFFWAYMRFTSGFSYYALLIILESWLNEKSPERHRGKILAVYSIIFYLSMAIGQFILSFDIQNSTIIFIIGAMLVLVSIIFISMTKVKEPKLQPFERYSLPRIFSIAPLALLGGFTGGFLFGGFMTMIPVYILDKFTSVEVVSYFMGSAVLGAMLSQWPIGILSDHFGRKLLLGFAGFFVALIAAVFILFNPSGVFLYILAALLGMGIFCIYPLALARANDVLDEHKDIIEISRALLFIYGFGSFVAPLVLSFGRSALPEFIFSSFFILGLFLAIFAATRPRINPEDTSAFVNMPTVFSPEVQNLDPRQ
ncbi:MAG: MFS transporter [Sulfurimonadaceae bacterium]|jgi:MFS family permease|nr:MFS transporter [Sulfurimonadaceae bacterium]